MRFVIITLILFLMGGCSALNLQHPYVGQTKEPFRSFGQSGHHNVKVGLFVFDYDYEVVGDKLKLSGIMYCSEGEIKRDMDYVDIWAHFLITDGQNVVREYKKRKFRAGHLCEERTFEVELPYKLGYSGIRIHWNWKGYS